MNGLYDFDLSAFRAINIGLHSSFLDPFFMLWSYIGLGGVQAALALCFLLHKSTRRFVIPLLLADAVGGLLVADGLKALIPRDRPSNLPWAIHQEPIFISSFPSGHSTTAFSVATMLVFLTWSTRYRWWGLLSLVEAVLIAFSRVYRGVHWPTDVIAGACFGIATSCFLSFILPLCGITLNQSSVDLKSRKM